LLTVALLSSVSSVAVAILQENVMDKVKRVVDDEEQAERLQQLRQQRELAAAMREDARWKSDDLSPGSRGNLPPSPVASRLGDMR
jgi:hypothetical protein